MFPNEAALLGQHGTRDKVETGTMEGEALALLLVGQMTLQQSRGLSEPLPSLLQKGLLPVPHGAAMHEI